MASGRRNSSSAVIGGETILGTAIQIMSENGNTGKSPREIAEYGVDTGLLRVPRGRTSSYLTQLVQSSLYNSVLSAYPLVYRTKQGVYKANVEGMSLYGC